jgi:hypothetical protein
MAWSYGKCKRNEERAGIHLVASQAASLNVITVLRIPVLDLPRGFR